MKNLLSGIDPSSPNCVISSITFRVSSEREGNRLEQKGHERTLLISTMDVILAFGEIFQKISREFLSAGDPSFSQICPFFHERLNKAFLSNGRGKVDLWGEGLYIKETLDIRLKEKTFRVIDHGGYTEVHVPFELFLVALYQYLETVAMEFPVFHPSIPVGYQEEFREEWEKVLDRIQPQLKKAA